MRKQLAATAGAAATMPVQGAHLTSLRAMQSQLGQACRYLVQQQDRGYKFVPHAYLQV